MSRADDNKSTAWDELHAFLSPGEQVDSICFGNWGWTYGEEFEIGDGEPSPPIPVAIRGVPMSLSAARKHMQSWVFSGGFGGPDTYATVVWTNLRVIWVHEYDGSTGLSSVPRNPSPCSPRLSGAP